ncbi:MAG: NAD(+)/NADH kinase [Treponema sp.]|nr:NAD(+)/NADH kinase [Treponema sp.]
MKNCLIVVNTDKAQSEMLGIEAANFLKLRDVDFTFLDFNGNAQDCDWKKYDFVITLGGDGTVLFAARGAAKHSIPVFPVNLGEFGFIAGVQPDEWQESLDLFLQGKLNTIRRTMLCAEIIRDQKSVARYEALNDIVVSAKSAAQTISMDISVNGSPLGRFKADGAIVSSPTGSTAYSASAGGPIVGPDLDALVLTPLNPFSLSARPIVFSSRALLRAEIIPSRNRDSILTVDGQKPIDLKDNDIIQIKKSEHDAILAGTSVEKFYNALRNKLNWSGGPNGGSRA